MQPVIKWSGSKRYQVAEILSQFPKNIHTYYEPFLGGGSVLMGFLELLENNKDYNVSNIICSDINKDLIGIWNLIKNDLNFLITEYTKHYNIFHELSLVDKKNYYTEQRRIFNNELSNVNNEHYALFFWLTRTCFNGLIRFNKKGEFTTSCHFSRSGIQPEKLIKILKYTSELLNKYNVQFIHGSYEKIIKNVHPDDLLYCDPPYDKSDGMYQYNAFDFKKFIDWTCTQECNMLLSYDHTDDTKIDITNIYKNYIYINAGKSSFKKLLNNKDANIFSYDVLYINVKKR